MSNFYIVLEGGYVSGTRKREISEAMYRLFTKLRSKIQSPQSYTPFFTP